MAENANPERGVVDSLNVNVLALLSGHQAELARSRQVLVVVGAGSSRFVRVWLVEKAELSDRQDGAVASKQAPGEWRVVRGGNVGLPGVIGARGFAPSGAKREGDKRTPSGAFTMTEAFGDLPLDRAHPQTGLPYSVAGPTDWWCDDPLSPMYNRRVSVPAEPAGSGATRGLEPATPAVSAEPLHRDDDLYRLVVVIDYNRFPVVPGMGSGIFLHKADPNGAGTLGCVGLSEADLRAVVASLDPALSPMILMGTMEDLPSGPVSRSR